MLRTSSHTPAGHHRLSHATHIRLMNALHHRYHIEVQDASDRTHHQATEFDGRDRTYTLWNHYQQNSIRLRKAASPRR